ncbi:hypothetical protein AB6805_14730 [Chitinophaga sp. RCC_12]|uniref:hypothetical protein n=1 Tax=Chitinophaga sp. RCC_12 TaxID=3239226 RepID=UPI0035244F62
MGKTDIKERVFVGYRFVHGSFYDTPTPVYETRVNQCEAFTIHDTYREPVDRHGGLDPNQSQEWRDFDVRTTYRSLEDLSAGKNGSKSAADILGMRLTQFSAAMGPENAALPAGGLGNLQRRSATVSFYTVQSSEDASRLLSGGNPWPTASTRGQWGEGLYAWGSKAEAQAYLDTYLKRGVTNVSIVEFKIDGFKLGKLSQHTVIRGTDEATSFFDKYSRLYGEGLPHGFDYIKAPTANYGSEHFFSKGVFQLFKGSK